MAKKCSCRIGFISGDCPFSYDNGWHARKDAMLLEIDLPKVSKHVAKLKPAEVKEAILDRQEYIHGETLDNL